MQLDNKTYEELNSLLTQINAELASRRSTEIEKLRAEVQQRAASLGLSIADLFGGKAGKKTAKAVAAKYANPQDPSQQWTGRGRKPQWVHDALTAGKTLEELAI
ncbi:H-NS histone family protein [Chitinibacter tainanensis]|uniref:H-NS histone family protein n=1 Tax=Chitinibacter tainanensis TaxID=230667 RepID=UPI002354583D|nr:H-NS histone family protein [Chitinibacter tainanensis]